nr:transcription factor BIM1-like isoform X1 [Coffea arabica]
MELRQPRPFGTEGRKTTHDFLSLYSPVQQDPRPPQGGFLKTQDFLQPLEQGCKNDAKEEDKVEINDLEKPPPAASPSNIEHLLPGGIGTYSITYFNQRFLKPEGNVYMMAQASSTNINDENSNCSSYAGGGFTLWDESAVKKGKTGKENNAGDRAVLKEAEANVGAGQWRASAERPSQSSSNHKLNAATFSSLSTSKPSLAQRNQSFVNMITSAKSFQEEDDDDDDEEEFVIKKEPSSHPKGNLSVKVDGKSTDQKPSTPRSKHSATEQRRRSKINDRFQKLREIIPHSDQKRDKASFLLEVIEYIQFLQDKVQKYEGPYPGWNQELSKPMPWRNLRGPEDFINSTQVTNIGSNPLIHAAKLNESKVTSSSALAINGQHLESDVSSAAAFGEKDHQPDITDKAASVPMALRHGIFPFGGTSTASVPLSSTPASDIDKTASHPQHQFWPRGSCTADSNITDKLKDQELTIESGTISISSIYSRGLLSTLTQALQSSGIDLSQANISVQIDLGKRANGRVNSSASVIKDVDVPSCNQAMPRSIVTRAGEDSPGQALKRLKTSRS